MADSGASCCTPVYLYRCTCTPCVSVPVYLYPLCICVGVPVPLCGPVVGSDAFRSPRQASRHSFEPYTGGSLSEAPVEYTNHLRSPSRAEYGHDQYVEALRRNSYTYTAGEWPELLYLH